MTRTLRISLLGDVVIQLGDDFVTGLPSRAAEALLIYLVCSPRPVAREKLAELLWAERTTVQALTNLRTVLTALRRELGDYLVVTRQTLAFDRSRDYWLDVAEFERGLAALGPARPTQPDAAQARRLQAVLDLYQGDFLEGFYLRDGQGFEEWATLQRERLRHLAREGFRTLASYQLKTGAYLEGAATAARWRHLDPYSEEACRTFMWLHTRAGQPHLALQCYQHFKALLEVDVGVGPGANTTTLFDQLRRLAFPPPLELPAPPAVFVGREAELAAVQRLLAESDSRLLTLAGPGGIGKTRLAIEAARSLAQRLPGRFLDGVFFVPLAALQSAESIPTQIADWARIPLQGAAPPGQQVLAYLAGREVLLLLDNVEHLLDAQGTTVNFLVDLLRQAPGVKLLLTSRERLSLYEEVIFDVEGLATAQDDGELAPSSAALLFVESARRVSRGFAPGAADLGCIVRACRLVEGTPLAIELAASWLRHYSCPQIVQQIEHSLDFLASDYRDLPERQRSLRSVFEYSWRLLSAEEQTALAQLSVFAGGFTHDAAQALLGPAAPVLDLADKSLLQRQAGARFDLHPLVRSYAAEKLALHPPAQIDITDRHAAYFLDYVTAQGSGESAQQRAALRAEVANIRCAWEWAARRRMVEPLGRAAATLHGFFSLQSWFPEGIDLFAQAIGALEGEAVRDAAVAGLRGELLGRKARMHLHIGELAQARADLQQALADLPPFEDAARRGSVLDSLAITHYYAGDYAQAADLARQRLRLAELAGNQEGIGFALNFLGSCAKAEGHYAEALSHFQAAAEHCMQRQDEIGAAMVFNNLGNLLQATGDWLGAQRYYQQSSVLFKAHDHVHGAATTLANAGRLAGKLGSHQEARALLLESLALKRQIGDARGEAVSLAGLGEVALAAGAYGEARTYLEHAVDLAHQAGDLKQMLEIAVAFAGLHIKLGQADAAVRLLHFTLNHPGTSQEARQTGEALAGDLAYDWRAASPPAPGIALDDLSSLLALLHNPDP
jgi:predicted ATPase/DNA-binding SARP family transcriptional activator